MKPVVNRPVQASLPANGSFAELMLLPIDFGPSGPASREETVEKVLRKRGAAADLTFSTASFCPDHFKPLVEQALGKPGIKGCFGNIKAGFGKKIMSRKKHMAPASEPNHSTS
jgi:hypothetical protein